MRRMSAPARLFESSSREQSTRTIVRSVYQSTALNKAVKLSEALVPCQTSASFRVGLGALNFGASAMGTHRFVGRTLACPRARDRLKSVPQSDAYPGSFH